ncbi:unnamed protein product [Peronospora belbahrii]|uniref:Uncharacterized protein n=1 Tax=Peronospora belbahrii TaxID=622444 RepID=A0AAU9L7B7_9STRA|nr:unnamed protein product [Peronospora belbahrii]CAH0481490.1 unnamed protein product [Peronospora belbahrii]CAH0481493.1 unnamed protein product [Peronospora belbahrii]
MKFSIFLVAAIAILGVVTATDQPAVTTPAEALKKIQASALPDGVTLTGTTEKIDPPATAVVAKESHARDDKDDDDDEKEQFGWGLGGLGGWGLGGWGSGLLGWAYPLGYWNTFGAGLYGGGCGLGVPFGGLYYC